MTTNTRKTVLATLLAALAATPLAVAPLQVQAQAEAQHVYTQAELDQMLAPIALYPDSLLSQVLMAATYPIEVVEAARWSRANPGLQGDDAVRAVENEDWDPSVKSLVAFPQILQRMDEKLDWTRSLGDAFLAQEQQMMDQVQQLRQRAEANGNLRSDEQIRVVREGPVIVVRPARPEYIYVPYYDPLEVYGTWWWPAYRPVAWSPWPGYVRPYHRPGISVGFWWGRPVGLSLGFFFGDFDWGRRHVRVAHNPYYYRGPVYVNRSFAADRSRWHHDPHHRRAVAYRNTEVRQRFATAQLERREAVREERRESRQLDRRDATPAQRAERREDRRDDRQAGRQQAQPAAAAQTQPQAVTPAQRAERRDGRRDEGRADRRAERQAAPAATPAQQATPPRAETPAQRTERRDESRADRRDDRRAERQAPPAAMPAQPAAQPRSEQRNERRNEGRADQRAERQAAADGQRQAQRQAQDAQRQAQQQAQRQAQQQAQRQAQDAQRQAQQQARQQQRAAMPAAQAPQTSRAERQERREQRKDHDKG